ncbi:amidohydrolase [Gynurincola endophyticus]|uniref:amidohydrolase n=1 Tax=Gynurincola endophyticus TaxID=2479004 RepID=UPI000F8F7D4B|nr:amidohydrolase [Gynurincola endophyticus]
MRKIFLLLYSFISLPTFFYAQSSISVDQRIAAEANKINQQVIEWRRHLHQHPELSNREFETAAFVKALLKEMGLDVKTNIAHTGVVATLKGGKPGPVIGLRADMDALPVLERGDLPFKSTAKGIYNGEEVPVMHACGHDAHVAMLLGAAKVLSSMRDQVPGTIRFVFQPAEEGAPAGEKGGAPLMIAEGIMDNPAIEAMFGIHISAEQDLGTIAYRSGGLAASSDRLTIKVKGKQTHGASPWQGVDPIVISANIITALQTVVSRQTELTKSPLVVTIGKIDGGIRSNIIPEEVVMDGTIRCLDATVQEKAHEKIKQVAEEIGKTMGADVTVTIRKSTPVLANNEQLVNYSIPALIKAAGKDKVYAGEWGTGAEDFAFYGHRAPIFFFRVGARPVHLSKEEAFSHHTPDFYIDDSRLDVGVKAFAYIVMNGIPAK